MLNVFPIKLLDYVYLGLNIDVLSQNKYRRTTLLFSIDKHFMFSPVKFGRLSTDCGTIALVKTPCSM